MKNSTKTDGGSGIPDFEGKPTRISLQDAKQRATNWRDLVANLPSIDNKDGEATSAFLPDKKIFRAININMADVDSMRSSNPSATSFRVYLSIPYPASPFHICGMLVPVDVNNKDILTAPNYIGTDIDGFDPGTSTIYDFTQPCPNICDTVSPLFNDDNSITPYI
jgi:hypothetical protein